MNKVVRCCWMPVMFALGLLLGGCRNMTDRSITETRTNSLGMTAMKEKRTYTKPAESELRKQLSNLEYEVTQRAATEPPFQNRYWDNHAPGLYVDIVSGEPLFSSSDKFDSGTGWPSFVRPIEASRVRELRDSSHGMERIEVRSRSADSHLGHVFTDGPSSSENGTGLRYCINSVALRFVPLDQMVEQGYGDYVSIVNKNSVVVPDSTNSCVLPPEGVQPGCSSALETAILAGGCFWGMEDLLRKIPGVLSTEVGYIGGTSSSPKYEDVKTGRTGHAEAVRVVFDPKVLSFEDLLEKWFFRMHDPTTLNRQGNDVGTQYRSAIFYTTEEQKKIAATVKERVDKSGRWKSPLVTEIVEAGPFTNAEEYHQDYLEKHPDGYSCHFLRE